MKLEVGKSYVTRDRKIVVKVVKKLEENFVLGEYEMHNGKTLDNAWLDNGQFVVSIEEHPFDLVQTVEDWVAECRTQSV